MIGNEVVVPVKVLIVDDEPDLEGLIVQKFRRQIREGRFEFHFASDGAEALQLLETEREIELVLTDINMPRMDGLTLLSRLQDLDHPALKAVIVSAYGDMDNIRVAMNRGAFDFLTKPIDLRDLETTVEKALRELVVIKEGLRVQAKLTSIEHELSVARKIQQGIVPTCFPAFPERNDFDIFGQMIPALQVGGDFYDFFLLDERRIGFVIGDVSGKGVPAAIMMAVSRTLLRAVALRGERAGDCLKKVNDLLCADNEEAMFVTVFYAILDTLTGELEYSNGGHNSPYVARRDGSVRTLKGPPGVVLGILCEALYETETLTLSPGDVVFLYTDGVTEAMNQGEDLFSEERLKLLLQQHRGETLEGLTKVVIEAVRDFSAGVAQSDDITILAVRYR